MDSSVYISMFILLKRNLPIHIGGAGCHDPSFRHFLTLEVPLGKRKPLLHSYSKVASFFNFPFPFGIYLLFNCSQRAEPFSEDIGILNVTKIQCLKELQDND